MKDTPTAKQMFALIEEVKKAQKAGLIDINRISPLDNYIHFTMMTDKRKAKKVADSLLERYTHLQFMWDSNPDYVSCVVYYYEPRE